MTHNWEYLGTLKRIMFDWLPPLNFASPTWDLFIILFFVVVSLLYGMSLGRDRILAIIVAASRLR